MSERGNVASAGGSLGDAAPEGGQATSHDVQRKGCKKKPNPWSVKEDEILQTLVQRFGARNWAKIAKHIPARGGKSCRLRWCNQLNPALKKHHFSEWEDAVILKARETHGNKWAVIARFLKGRTDNGIKNHYNSTLRRKVMCKTFRNRFLEQGVDLKWLLNNRVMDMPGTLGASGVVNTGNEQGDEGKLEEESGNCGKDAQASTALMHSFSPSRSFPPRAGSALSSVMSNTPAQLHPTAHQPCQPSVKPFGRHDETHDPEFSAASSSFTHLSRSYSATPVEGHEDRSNAFPPFSSAQMSNSHTLAHPTHSGLALSASKHSPHGLTASIPDPRGYGFGNHPTHSSPGMQTHHPSHTLQTIMSASAPSTHSFPPSSRSSRSDLALQRNHTDYGESGNPSSSAQQPLPSPDPRNPPNQLHYQPNPLIGSGSLEQAVSMANSQPSLESVRLGASGTMEAGSMSGLVALMESGTPIDTAMAENGKNLGNHSMGDNPTDRSPYIPQCGSSLGQATPAPESGTIITANSEMMSHDQTDRRSYVPQCGSSLGQASESTPSTPQPYPMHSRDSSNPLQPHLTSPDPDLQPHPMNPVPDSMLPMALADSTAAPPPHNFKPMASGIVPGNLGLAEAPSKVPALLPAQGSGSFTKANGHPGQSAPQGSMPFANPEDDATTALGAPPREGQAPNDAVLDAVLGTELLSTACQPAGHMAGLQALRCPPENPMSTPSCSTPLSFSTLLTEGSEPSYQHDAPNQLGVVSGGESRTAASSARTGQDAEGLFPMAARIGNEVPVGTKSLSHFSSSPYGLQPLSQPPQPQPQPQAGSRTRAQSLSQPLPQPQPQHHTPLPPHAQVQVELHANDPAASSLFSESFPLAYGGGGGGTMGQRQLLPHAASSLSQIARAASAQQLGTETLSTALHPLPLLPTQPSLALSTASEQTMGLLMDDLGLIAHGKEPSIYSLNPASHHPSSLAFQHSSGLDSPPLAFQHSHGFEPSPLTFQNSGAMDSPAFPYQRSRGNQTSPLAFQHSNSHQHLPLAFQHSQGPDLPPLAYQNSNGMDQSTLTTFHSSGSEQLSLPLPMEPSSGVSSGVRSHTFGFLGPEGESAPLTSGASNGKRSLVDAPRVLQYYSNAHPGTPPSKRARLQVASPDSPGAEGYGHPYPPLCPPPNPPSSAPWESSALLTEGSMMAGAGRGMSREFQGPDAWNGEVPEPSPLFMQKDACMGHGLGGNLGGLPTRDTGLSSQALPSRYSLDGPGLDAALLPSMNHSAGGRVNTHASPSISDFWKVHCEEPHSSYRTALEELMM